MNFTLTTDAGKRFFNFTNAAKDTHTQMAIVLENKIKEVASIQSAIQENGRITGGFTGRYTGTIYCGTVSNAGKLSRSTGKEVVYV